MSDQVKTLKEKFDAMSSGSRTALIGAVVVAAMFTVGTIMTDDGKPKAQKKPGGERQSITVFNPGSTNATEAVAADLQAANKRMQEQAAKIALLEETARQTQAQTQGTEGRWNEISNLAAQVQNLQERLNNVADKGGQAPAAAKDEGILSGVLPKGKELIKSVTGDIDNTPAGKADVSSPVTEAPKPVTIQVVGNTTGGNKPVIKKEVPAAYMPSGSNFEAILLNGMDASTAIGANRSPTPALLRIKTDAILPNMVSFNVRECFVMVGGFGNLSSERVEMRTENMSCISDTGEVYEGKVEGYLVGEDGKAGARGRVVSKQGALLAKSFMAGFAGGLGNAFTPQPVQSLNLSGGAQQQYQYPGADQVLGSSIAGGLNRSSQALAQFYIKLAEQMFPIVELDAGRKMTIVLLKGVELKMEKKG